MEYYYGIFILICPGYIFYIIIIFYYSHIRSYLQFNFKYYIFVYTFLFQGWYDSDHCSYIVHNLYPMTTYKLYIIICIYSWIYTIVYVNKCCLDG